jgi:hypothetical protein
MADKFRLDIDANDLDLEEVEEIEDRTGRPVDTLLEGDGPKMKLVRCLVWIQLRRANPDADRDALWQEAGKVKLANIETPASEVPPTDASV